MSNYKSTSVCIDVLLSAVLEPVVNTNEEGEIALFKIRTFRNDVLCPAQGMFIRSFVNNFNKLILSVIEPMDLHHQTDMIVIETLQMKLNVFLNRTRKTLTEYFQEQLLILPMINPVLYEKLNRVYM